MLAKRIGIGIPSLYAAFGDKKSLFREVVDVYARTHGAFTERASPQSRLHVQASNGCCAKLPRNTRRRITRTAV
ncbi:hypothetical protein [Cryptosporangium sp. NPDC048952]|uniref:hypothetical protein n=1 Tax=Cryptosporangium sp. NPDC048952 TaxID=3363961 RepID=UPI0037223145